MDYKKDQCCCKDPNLSSYNPAHLDQNHSQSHLPPGMYSTWLSSFLHCHNDLTFQRKNLLTLNVRIWQAGQAKTIYMAMKLYVCVTFTDTTLSWIKQQRHQIGSVTLSPGSGTFRTRGLVGVGVTCWLCMSLRVWALRHSSYLPGSQYSASSFQMKM